MDLAFHSGTGADAPILALQVHPDGRLNLGGNFSQFDGTRRVRIARLHGQLVMNHLRLDDSALRVSVLTATGGKYWLEASDHLAAPVWNPITSTDGNGQSQTLTGPPSGATRFYRVRVE